MVDTANMYVDFDAYRPIGRLFGNLYSYQREPFTMVREDHSQWSSRPRSGDVKRAGDVQRAGDSKLSEET